MQIPTARQLMQEAELDTGLSEWTTGFTGDPFTVLDILVNDLNSHSRLHALGAQRMYRRLHENLCARLKYIADRKRHPQVDEETIAAPLFILGLPRSGTTLLHNLLGAAPHNRAPRSDEMQFPAPKQTAVLARQLRVQLCHESLVFQGLMDEDWQGVHPMAADRAEECTFIWELFQLSPNYPALAEIPNYQNHLYTNDFTKLYREQKAFLQYLQHREGKRRWVLKTPIHIRFLKEIIEVFPDAMFIHCHRDTAKVYPSIARMADVLHGKFADRAPGANAVIGDYDNTWSEALAFRRQPGMAERFIDIQFMDLCADPLGTVETIYSHFGMEFDDACKQTLNAWLVQDRADRAKQKHHEYTLESAGLTEADIDRLTGDYLRAFRVPLERKVKR